MDTRPPASPLAATRLESARTNSPRPDTPATRLESHPYAICRENPFRMTSLRKNPRGEGLRFPAFVATSSPHHFRTSRLSDRSICGHANLHCDEEVTQRA